MKINLLIKSIKEKLAKASSSQHEAEQQAWWMLEEITGKKKSELLINLEIEISKNQEVKLNKWIEERVTTKKPLQYIIGYVPFLDLKIKTEPPILIPRPETEEWVAWLIEKINKGENKKLKILDLGTGSGCIALSLAKAFPKSQVYGVDINEKAIELANKNKKINNIKNAEFIISNFYSNIPSDIKYDLIVSNPPYIKNDDWKTLHKTVKDWEDKRALTAGKSGLNAFEEILKEAKYFLDKNSSLKIPRIILEIGIKQEDEVKCLLVKYGFNKVNFFSDLQGINRWITATL